MRKAVGECMMGTHHGTFRCSPQLPPLALRMPPPQGRRSLRTHRRHPHCGHTVPSSVHLSLQASHRRGWGSLYAALDRGRIDIEALRGLLARHPLAGSRTTTPVYAVDASVWPRCDAECSPLLKATTTTRQGTRLASRSSLVGPTSSSPRSASFARVGPPPSTWRTSARRRTPTRWPPSR